MSKQAIKWVTLLLAVTLMVTSIQELQFHSLGAEKKSEKVYESDGVAVEFKVNSQWETGFEGQFIIINESDKPLENWRVKFKFNHEIVSMWDGEIESRNGKEYVIKHPKWNQNIPVGGKVIVGFNGKSSKSVKPPYDCTIPTGKIDAPKEDYTITYKVTSDWQDAFNAEISITNNTSKMMEGWSLEFDFDKKISQFWTAKIIKQEGNHYIIKNDDWNSVIKPGQTIKLGFEAKPGNASTEPENYKLVKSQMEAPEEEIPEEYPDGDGITEEDLKIDTDKDELPDCIELKITKTDLNNKDTDGDGVPDGYEVIQLGSDPLVKDSDRDEDKDGLTNMEEYQLGTDPVSTDSDLDGISDYDEVKKHNTDSLEEDTDGDKLEDGDEILLGFNPLKPDTNGNGILDSEEKVNQTLTQAFDMKESEIIRKVSIQGECSKNINRTTTIENYYDVDVQTTDVVGLVGIPVNIESESKFDKVDVIFEYGTLPSEVKEDNLGILWYNEKEESYELQDNILDKTTHTVRFSTAHFSTYMLVDKQQWEKIWNIQIDYGNAKEAVEACNIAYVVDYTQSMSNGKLPKLRESIKQFIGAMQTGEEGCIIGYKLETANILSGLTGSKDILREAVDQLKIDTKSTAPRAGVTNLGIDKAIIELSKDSSGNGKMILLIGDADIGYSKALMQKAKEKKIRLFVMNVNPKIELVNLKRMSKETNGFYYELSDLNNAYNIFYEMKYITRCGINTTDKDDDGLLDVYETKGMRLCNGKLITSDSSLADTDSDGLTDYEETGDVFWNEIQIPISRSRKLPLNTPLYKLKSYLYMADSDMDGIPDSNIGGVKDSLPKSNRQNGHIKNYKKGKLEYSYPISYEFDYRWFQRDNTEYNKKLQNISSIFATLAYYNSKDSKAEQYKMTDENDKSIQNIMGVMKKYGFTGVEEHYLGDKYKDNDIVQFNLGQKELYYDKQGISKKVYHIVPIFIRGTKGQKEWYSNFDIGNTNDVNKYPDWTNSSNHKGFDVAANRVIAETKAYLKKNNLNSDNSVLWITGHSRGAAVANLVAKKMGDLKYDTYTYTFATPNVTTDTTATFSKYHNIFNLVNEDDFIPSLPLESWGFKKYGKTEIRDMDENMKIKFKSRVLKNKSKYKGAEISEISEIVGAFSKIAEKRNECTEYTCACHSKEGENKGKSITRYVKSSFDKQLIELIMKADDTSYSKELKSNCKFTLSTKILDGRKFYTYYVCESPMYFMNKLAIVMGGDFGDIVSFGSMNIADKYEDAKWKLAFRGGVIQDPHFADSYILLSE